LDRVFATALVIVLLAATAAAFAVTERLKLEPSPITDTHVDKVFSPVCECDTAAAHVDFRLRRADRVTVEIIGAGSKVVRTLALRERLEAGRLDFAWDGRSDAGGIVAEGNYRPRVILARHGRTFNLPNPIRVDATPPHVRLVSAAPRVFSPDRDGRADKLEVAYRLSEPGHPLLFVNGKRRVQGRWERPSGQLEWYGRVAGRSFRTGLYRVTVLARDLAGNLSSPSRTVAVRVRYIALARDVIRAKALTRFGVRVSTDARAYRWRLGKRRGVAHGRLLVLRAPAKPGRYRLVVEERGHADRALVVVRKRG
jgi:flagellar hook capping protein FlgD